MLPFRHLSSKHISTNIVFCHVSAVSFVLVRVLCNSPEKVYLKHEFEKGLNELNKNKKKIIEGETSG